MSSANTRNEKSLFSYPEAKFEINSAILSISSIGISAISSFTSEWADRARIRINAINSIREINESAVRIAANASAVFSVASIDIAHGTARAVVERSISEANREVGIILRGSGL